MPDWACRQRPCGGGGERHSGCSSQSEQTPMNLAGSLEAAGVAWANSNSSSATFRCQQCRRSGVLHLRHLPRPRRRRPHLLA
jgi:hypothetical protein